MAHPPTAGSVRNHPLFELMQDHEALYPRTLAEHFPHVADNIARLWTEPEEERRYLKSLLVTERIDRKGFPFKTCSELFALFNFYSDAFPPPKMNGDIWNWIVDKNPV